MATTRASHPRYGDAGAGVDRRARVRGRAALLFVLPFVFVGLTSLMCDQQTLSRDLWPQPSRGTTCVDVWHTPGFATWWRNTLIYAVAGTALTLVSSIPVAYALAYFRFRGRNLAMMVVMATMMLPPQVVIMPMYLFWAKELHLSGTLWPLIIPLAFGDAFSIFLLRQFLLTVPREYIDAAEDRRLQRPRCPAARGDPTDRGRPSRPWRSSSSSTAGTTTSDPRSTPARTRARGR